MYRNRHNGNICPLPIPISEAGGWMSRKSWAILNLDRMPSSEIRVLGPTFESTPDSNFEPTPQIGTKTTIETTNNSTDTLYVIIPWGGFLN
jgi:hypothetical protein